MPIEFEVERKGIKHVAWVDEIDGDLIERHWFVHPSVTAYTSYLQRMVYTPSTYDEKIHTVIIERMLGRALLKGEEVDHINRNGLDNRRENLRLATRSQNMANKTVYLTNKLGVKGVYLRNNRYRAQIQVEGRKIMLGTFDTLDEAREAYKQAAVKHFGEFARFE
jgi:hypothetical protein